MRAILIEDTKTPELEQWPSVNKHNRWTTIADAPGIISFEFCTGRFLNAPSMRKLEPRFCSVTWQHQVGLDLENAPAIMLAERLYRCGYNVLVHLAGRNLRKGHVLQILMVLKKIGIRNILALQGDPSQVIELDDQNCDFAYASELVKFIRAYFGQYFYIGVAGYPEGHPSSHSLTEDIDYLKFKVSCGADFIITQASYDYKDLERFSKICKSSGIYLPIIPGIFIVSSYKSLHGLSKFCKISIPSSVSDIVDKYQDSPGIVREFGITHTVRLLRRILERRSLFNGAHIFCLNDIDLLKEVFKRLGLYKFVIERPLKIKK